MAANIAPPLAANVPLPPAVSFPPHVAANNYPPCAQHTNRPVNYILTLTCCRCNLTCGAHVNLPTIYQFGSAHHQAQTWTIAFTIASTDPRLDHCPSHDCLERACVLCCESMKLWHDYVGWNCWSCENDYNEVYNDRHCKRCGYERDSACVPYSPRLRFEARLQVKMEFWANEQDPQSHDPIPPEVTNEFRWAMAHTPLDSETLDHYTRMCLGGVVAGL